MNILEKGAVSYLPIIFFPQNQPRYYFFPSYFKNIFSLYFYNAIFSHYRNKVKISITHSQDPLWYKKLLLYLFVSTTNLSNILLICEATTQWMVGGLERYLI